MVSLEAIKTSTTQTSLPKSIQWNYLSGKLCCRSREPKEGNCQGGSKRYHKVGAYIVQILSSLVIEPMSIHHKQFPRLVKSSKALAFSASLLWGKTFSYIYLKNEWKLTMTSSLAFKEICKGPIIGTADWRGFVNTELSAIVADPWLRLRPYSWRDGNCWSFLFFFALRSQCHFLASHKMKTQLGECKIGQANLQEQ